MSRHPRLSRVALRLPQYEGVVAAYLGFMRCHRGRRTVHQLENALAQFCTWLDSRGHSGFGQLKPSTVRDYISSLGRFRKSTVAVHASALRGFLSYLRLDGSVSTDLASVIELPPRYSMADPPRALPPSVVERLLAGVDKATALGRRDFAMLLLAARYGMRSSDIRGLRFDQVHWREQRILLVLSKTQRRLELPLLADVDHALVSYIRHGRPACGAREIFVRHLAPVSRLAQRNSLWSVMHRALKAARVTIPSGERGLRLLRHSAATSLLGRGVRLDTISDILGHACVDTTRRYAQVDLASLRTVALSEIEIGR